MDYYVYISKSKVDMLYDQIATSKGEKSESSIGFDLKLLKGSTKTSQEAVENYYVKLKAVLEALEREGKIGEVWGNDGKEFIRGELDLKWLLDKDLGTNSSYWGLNEEKRALALMGSVHHVIGHHTVDQPEGLSASILFTLFHNMKDRLESPLEELEKTGNYPGQLRMLTDRIVMPSQRFEFTAKVLYHGRDSYSKELSLVASPLYVIQK